MITVFHRIDFFDCVFDYLTVYDLANFEKSHKKGKEISKYSKIWEEFARDRFSYQFPQEISLVGKNFLYLCQNRDLNIKNGIFIPHEILLTEGIGCFAFSESNFCYLTKCVWLKELYVVNIKSGQKKELAVYSSMKGQLINDEPKLAINDRWLVSTQESPKSEAVTVYDLSNDKPRLIKFKEGVKVTAVALNGNILLTGHENGDVYSTDLLSQKEDLLPRKEKVLTRSKQVRSIAVSVNRICISYAYSNVEVFKKEDSLTYSRSFSYLEIPYSVKQRLFFNENDPDDPILAQNKKVSAITDCYKSAAIYVSNAEAIFVKGNRCFIPDSVQVYEMDGPLPLQSIDRRVSEVLQCKFNIGRIATQKLKNSPMESIFHSDGLRFVGLRARDQRYRALVVYDYSCSTDQVLEYLANSLETTDFNKYPSPETFKARIAELTLCFNNLPAQLKKGISKVIYPYTGGLQAFPICKDENSLNFSNIFYNTKDVKGFIAADFKLIAISIKAKIYPTFWRG